ncbi:hypothetical protein [Phenylobacterium sp.]|uniref:hypothetical protein n=1 Tax=Phenylobacterium sp. TaxID=1871053 RepID=UPI0025DC2105|nr:hypothetical protein [Phenylobacterium sp.]
MNGITLPDPFQAQDQNQPEYDFNESLNALLAKKYDANKIVGIMTSVGFDSVQVAQALNQRYEAERQQQINNNEAMKLELQKEKDAYEEALKKKDTASVQDGGPSASGLDSFGSVDERAQAELDALSSEERFARFGKPLSDAAALEEIKKTLPVYSEEQRREGTYAQAVQEGMAVSGVDPLTGNIISDPVKLDQLYPTEATVDLDIATVNLMDDLAAEGHLNYKRAEDLKDAIEANDNKAIVKTIQSLQADGLMTEFNVGEGVNLLRTAAKTAWAFVNPAAALTDVVADTLKPEEEEETEVIFDEETLSAMNSKANALLRESKQQQSNAINMANDFNAKHGVGFHYNPESNVDYQLFMSNVADRSISRELVSEEEVNDFIYRNLSEEERQDTSKRKEAEAEFYGTYKDSFLGNLAAADRSRGTWEDWWNNKKVNFGISINPLVGTFWGDDIEETMNNQYKQRKIILDQQAAERKIQLARDLNISPETMDMRMTNRLSAALDGDITFGDFFATSYANTAEIINNALISSAEFMIPYVGPAVVGADVYTQNYADADTYQPHMSKTEKALTSLAKSVAEVALEKYMFNKGLGSVGALRNAGRNITGKEAVKRSGLSQAKSQGLINKITTQYMLPEGLEEAAISAINQEIDMIGDVVTGRNVRDLNPYEISDAFFAGMVGALGPSSIASFTSNVGHSRTIKQREESVKKILELQKLYHNESNKDLKRQYEKKLKQELLRMKVLSNTEAALYSNLNEEEQASILAINQELSKIRDVKVRGEFWNGEEVTEQQEQELDQRAKNLTELKKDIEEEAIERETDKQPQVEATETQQDETVVDDVIDRPAQLSGFGGTQFDSPIDGDVYIEGQRVVFESKDGQVYDLGNIDDIRSDGVSSVNLIPQQSLVQVNEDGSLTVEGEKMNMQTELPTQGIEYNQDGSIKAVSLVDNSGNTKMYTGAVAEDLAYQILLNEIQTTEQQQKINEQLEQDEEFRQLREAQIRRSTTDKSQDLESITEERSDQAAVETPAQQQPQVKATEEIVPEQEQPQVEATEQVSPEQALPKELTQEVDERVFEKYTGDNPFRKVINIADKQLKKYGRSQGLMPASMSRMMEKLTGRTKTHMNNAIRNFNDFDKMLKAYKGDKDALIELYDNALKGDVDAINNLPVEFANHRLRLRNHVDRLSEELLSSGYFDMSTESGRMKAQTIADKMGTYLTRTYEVFDNPNYKPSEAAINVAKNYFTNKLRSALETEYNNDTSLQEKYKSFDEFLKDRVQGEVNKLLTKDTASAYIKAKSKLTAGTDVSKRKKDIPVEIRALMGEYKDPMQNYVKSIMKLAPAVEGQKAMNELREVALGKYLFENPTGDFVVQIASEGSTTMKPLKGLYTTQEIADALEEVPQNTLAFIQFLLKISSGVKWAKTIGSVGTHMKNVIGNLGFMWVNGHTDLSQLGKSYELIMNDFKKRGDIALRERMDMYTDLALIDTGVVLSEIREMFRGKSFDEAVFLNAAKNPFTRIGKIKKGITSTANMLNDAYQKEDDFFKIVAFENEMNRYSDALFNKPQSELTPQEFNALKEFIVDKRVKQTYPSYDRVPEGVKLPSKLFLGNFVSFIAESYRVSFNTLAIAAEERKSENPKLRKIGHKRFAGALSYLIAKSSLVSGFTITAGAGAVGLLGMVLNSDEEDEKQKAMRRYVAPWSVNSDLLPFGVGDGKFSYIDLSASDPFGSLSQIANSVTKDGVSFDSWLRGLVEAVSPFMDPDIGVRRLNNIVNAIDDNGRPLWTSATSTEDKVKIALLELYDVLEFGTLASARRIWSAEGALGKSKEALGLIGFRPYEIDVNKSFGYKMSAYRRQIRDAKKLEDLNEKNQKLKELEHEIFLDAEAAQNLGVRRGDLVITMKEFAGINQRKAELILIDRFIPEVK